MLKQKKLLLVLMMFILGMAAEVVKPEGMIRSAEAETQEAGITKEDICKAAYQGLASEISAYKAALKALETMKGLEVVEIPVTYEVNYHGEIYTITEEEYEVLLRIVESEATDEDIEGKMLVANVVLNRVHTRGFADTISEVVFAKGQFSPVSDGRFYRVTVSEETVEAVERVLAGEDESQGALYFMAPARASKSGKKWFKENLDYLFTHGRHAFYAEK